MLYIGNLKEPFHLKDHKKIFKNLGPILKIGLNFLVSVASSGIATHAVGPLLKAIGIFADEKDMDMLKVLETHRDDEKLKENIKMIFKKIAGRVEKSISDSSSGQIE